MESLSKQELISTISKQADQIKRYEARLRDVVAAYKGLVKEKEALEISLKALNKTVEPTEGDDSLAALTLSLSTLTAEKSRMEEAFQVDKKVTREKYENMLAAHKEETKSLVQQHITEVNNLKAKIAYEVQERERERADHAAMLKELHVKLNSERKTKEKLEDKVVTASDSQAHQAELEKRVRDLSSSLEASQRRLQRAEARTVETPALLVRLQQKLQLLEQSHSVAIREEQIKAKRAEESARKMCAKQEERVGALEGRVAELSQTVGHYDRRRRKDLSLIQHLKDQLNRRLITDIHTDAPAYEESQQKSETDNEKLADSEYLQTLIDKIHILKKELIVENEKLGHPIDITSIFKLEGYENVHTKCMEELETVRAEFDAYKALNVRVDVAEGEGESETEDLRSQIALLKEKVETYKMMLEEEKQEKIDSLKLSEEKMKCEKEYQNEVVSDLKSRVHSLEKQVQTQRERYSALLDETDNYIRARNDRNDRSRRVSAEESPAMLTDVTAPPHMLHYAHELARKDLDITQLRKEKHILEGQYRDCQREATIDKERFKEVIRTLKEEIDRLRRIQSREGANLEYLKNVVMAFIMSTDYAGRRHMLNAIAAVLHFTATEKNMVISTL